MKDDLISRQAAIDGIESFRPIKPTRGETSMEAVNRSAWDCAINCAESFVRTMPPSAQPNLQPTCNQLATDCISRQDAIDAIDRFSLGETDAVKLAFRMGDYLKRLPSAQPERKGRWDMLSKQSARCTACGNIQFTHGIDETMKGHIFYGIYRYCPHCGAKMEGDTK